MVMGVEGVEKCINITEVNECFYGSETNWSEEL
jgi:hypothetical protein